MTMTAYELDQAIIEGWQQAIAEARLLQSYLGERPLHPTETGVARENAVYEVGKRIEYYRRMCGRPSFSTLEKVVPWPANPTNFDAK